MALILFLSYCKDAPKSESSLYLNHADSVKYVGMQACASCHADKMSTFVQTGMGKSLGWANSKRSSALFTHVKPVYDAYKDLYYWPFMVDSSIYIKEYRLLNSDTIYSRIEKISYIVGSGHHTNSHLIAENGYVFQAPLTFYTQEGKWDLPPGFENGNNSGFERRIGLECMSCHNALPVQDLSAENRFLDIPHGIDCERCHGPGELHVKEKKAGNIVDISKHIDYSIVNPAKLSWYRQIDLCQRCHLQGNAVLKPGKSFADFKPGMRLSDVFDQFSPEYKNGDEFVMAAHAERFQMSACFKANVKGDLNSQSAQVGFTCISCHNPHVSVKQTNRSVFNSKCISCHSSQNQKLCSEATPILNSANNDCVQCHMPTTGASDIPHVTVHDHYIRKNYSKNNTLNRQLIGLRCITNPNPDIATETEAYVSYYEKFEKNELYLDKAKQLSSKLDESISYHSEILIHLYYINAQYTDIVRLVNNLKTGYSAWTAYRVAKSFELLKKPDLASEWFENALVIQKNNIDFLLQYSAHLVKIKQYKKAEKYLNTLLNLYNKSPDAWAYMGLVRLANSEYAKAKGCFEMALNLFPDQLTALQNLKILEELVGNKQEALKIQIRIDTIVNRNAANSRR
ncbi:MAG: pilus assembly protein TadD [Bacteroidia bacterium]|nr:pilus assembly protein TadD [Bacteroidia bacterium]